MDSNRQQFIKGFIDRGKAAGLPPQEVDSKLQSALGDYDAKNPATPPPGSSLEDKTRGVSDLLRIAGLGVIPNTLANVGDIAGSIHSGHKISASQNYDNPFRTSEELTQQLNTNPIINAAKDTAGAASWATPLGPGGLLARAGIGAGVGALQGVSQPNVDVGSVAKDAGTMAALNTLLPGLSRGVQSLGFKGAVGKSLPVIEGLEQKTGQSLNGTTREAMQGQLGAMQSLLQSNLKDLMDQGGTMSKQEVKNYLNRFLDPSDELGQKIGISENKAAVTYIRGLKDSLDNIVNSPSKVIPQDLLNKLPTKPGSDVAQSLKEMAQGTTSDGDALAPFYAFMKKVEKDVPQSFWDKFNPSNSSDTKTQSKIAAELRGYLRKEISRQSSNPNDFESTMKAKQTIGGIQADLSDESLKKSAKDLLSKAGLPVGVVGGLGLLTGNPLISVPAAGAGAFMGAAEKYPQLAPIMRNLLDNPKTAGIGDALMRVLSGKVGQPTNP